MIQRVLYIGVVALPLVMFLAYFGTDVVNWVKDVAPDIFDQASTFVGGGR